MDYRELIPFPTRTLARRETFPVAAEDARATVASWRVTDPLAEQLETQLLRWLQAGLPDAPEPTSTDVAALLVSGNAGFGKSHLLAAISALAQSAEWVTDVRHPTLASATERIAGRFQGVVLLAPRASQGLLAGLRTPLRRAAKALGEPLEFPRRATPKVLLECLADWARRVRAAHPDRGLLLVLDGVARRGVEREPAEHARDAEDLELLAQAARAGGFRFLADTRPGLFDGPDAEIPHDVRERWAENFHTFTLGAEALAPVIAERLVPKTPEQRARLTQHLARFADQDPRLARELDRFVDLYPIHPDYLEILARMSFTAERGVWETLEAAVRRVQRQPVPPDHPGFITFDDYWHELTGDPRLKFRPEIEGVVSACRSLERQMRKAVDAPARLFARRLIRALAVHRLTASTIYSSFGITAEELHAALGPWNAPAAAPTSADPPTSAPPPALECVREMLAEIRRVDAREYLAHDAESGRYGLHFQRFRRFVIPEVILHWVNAIPFLLLMLTGGLMLVARFAPVDPAWFSFAVLAHKCCAVSWLFSLPLTVLSQPRAHWQHIRVLLRWGIHDLLWMIQSTRSVYDRKTVIAPAGRFNTGQKTNASLIPFYFFSFGLTGAFMHFDGASLFPWYAHTALYFAAIASVGGHLYLALVNPGTRISLPAIFHGWSPMKYVEHHHPLSLPPSRRDHLPPASPKTLREELMLRKVEFVMLIAMVAMGSVGAATFNRSRVAAVKKQFAAGFAEAINPRALSIKHRFAAAGDACNRCHTFTGGIPDNRCSSCHQVVEDRRTQRVGFHGTMQGHCTECHKEHPAPNRTLMPVLPATFHHDQTTFPLHGQHQNLDCHRCHDRPRDPEVGIHFIGLAHDSCVDCHRDPHQGQFQASCTQCHSEKGWTGKQLQFSHQEDSRFPLVGKHAQVDCTQCHAPTEPGGPLATARFQGTPTDCASCHKDPHREPLADRCTTCHTPAGWKVEQLTFDHTRDTKFALTDRHATVACAQCHKTASPRHPLAAAVFRGTKTDCADCHRDPHRGQFEKNCTQCHSPKAWDRSQLSFEHNRDTRFPLVLQHAKTDCQKCHRPPAAETQLAKATFRGLQSACADCHRDPHRNQFQRDCTRCHTEPSTWTRADLHFEHNRDSTFALTGRHVAVDCQKCHVPDVSKATLASARFKSLPQACADCHHPNHPESYGKACLSCHDTTLAWPPERPSSLHFQRIAMDGERLSGRHLKADCRTCHVPEKVPQPHAFPTGKGTCVACHRADEPHQGVLGFNCGKCHGNQAWTGDDLRFNHNTMARFQLDENHATVACTKCHAKGQWKPLKSSCRDCHPNIF